MSEFKLIQEVLNNSVSSNWDDALGEWEFTSVFNCDNSTCACSHYPISAVCIIKNNLNNKTLEVGNCCVKKFMSDLDYFSALERIRKDASKSIGKPFLNKVIKDGLLDDWSIRFYSDVVSKRPKSLSDGQRKKRQEINRVILNKYIYKQGV